MIEMVLRNFNPNIQFPPKKKQNNNLLSLFSSRMQYSKFEIFFIILLALLSKFQPLSKLYFNWNLVVAGVSVSNINSHFLLLKVHSRSNIP